MAYKLCTAAIVSLLIVGGATSSNGGSCKHNKTCTFRVESALINSNAKKLPNISEFNLGNNTFSVGGMCDKQDSLRAAARTHLRKSQHIQMDTDSSFWSSGPGNSNSCCKVSTYVYEIYVDEVNASFGSPYGCTNGYCGARANIRISVPDQYQRVADDCGSGCLDIGEHGYFKWKGYPSDGDIIGYTQILINDCKEG